MLGLLEMPTWVSEGRLLAAVGSMQWAEQGLGFSSPSVEVPWPGMQRAGVWNWTGESQWQVSVY